MTKQKALQAIRKEKYWNVMSSGNRISVVRTYGSRFSSSISFSLVSKQMPVTKKLGFILEHPYYVFRNKISHFKSIQADVRLSLNKTYLKSIINMLKRTGIWPFIINKKFLVVNDYNSRSDKGKVNHELKDLLT